MTQNPNNDFDRQLEMLISGDLTPSQRREALEQLTAEPQRLDVLGNSLSERRHLQKTFGYDHSHAVEAGKSALKGAMRNMPESPVATPSWKPAVAWGVRAAAAVVVGVCLLLTISTRRQYDDLRQQHAELMSRDALPLLAPSEAEVRRAGRLWRQLAGAGQSWILLAGLAGEESGTLGNVEANGAAVHDGPVMLVRFWVIDAGGRPLLQRDLIAPRVHVRAHAGSVGGRTATMAVAPDEAGTVISLEFDNAGKTPVGVSGRVPAGRQGAEVGRFVMDSRELRVCAVTLPLGQ